MRYFSNRPGPTPGHHLPRPNCSAEVLREKDKVGLKRKIEGLETSNEHMLAHVFFSICTHNTPAIFTNTLHCTVVMRYSL